MHKTEGAEGILRRQIVDLLTGVSSPAGETASEWHRGCHSEAVKNLLAQGPHRARQGSFGWIFL